MQAIEFEAHLKDGVSLEAQQALARLQAKDAEALLVVKLDRLTRSVADLGRLIDTYFTPERAALMSVSGMDGGMEGKTLSQKNAEASNGVCQDGEERARLEAE